MTTSRRRFLSSLALAAAGATARSGAAEAGNSRRLFDGKTLAGWRPAPRLQTAPGGANPASLSPEDQARRQKILAHTGRWTIEDGAIVGGQEPPGSGLGAYLLSEETFGDFELELEARPDWCVDTGIMVRADATGGTGWQMLLDHRPNGCIGGFYGNGIGGFRCYPFIIDAETDANRVPMKMRAGDEPDGPVVPPHFAAPVAEFLRVWKPGGWNHFKVRAVGAIPVLTSWINGVKMCEVDAGRLEAPGYDKAKVAERLGARGHIAFEVHNNDPRKGNERWWPGAVCRWREMTIREP